MFEFLFKYSPTAFARGELVFASGWPVWLLVLAVAAAAAIVVVSLVRRRETLGAVRLAAIGLLEIAAIALALVLVWRPALTTETLRPQDNAVAIVLDTSASMSYGEGGSSRLQQAVTALDGQLLPRLDKGFEQRLYAFAGDVEPLESFTEVPAPGPVTHIGDALLGVLREARSSALGAVVLVSDGADNSGTLDAPTLAEIARFGVPVHTVGVGRESIPEDVELEDVSIAPEGLPGSRISAEVSVRHGRAGQVRLKVYDGDAILAERELTLPAGEGVTTRAIDFDLGRPGIRDLRFSLDPPTGDPDETNNTQYRPVEVPAARRHILYIEGEPRWEYKFIRRALPDDSPVRLASLLRTTPNKYYRQGLDAPDELEDGFPTEVAKLYTYDALIIGSFEAAALTSEQQEMIRDFVSRRGGSLLMLGGRRGLADGGWGNTVVAEALPARLPAIDAPSFERTFAKAQLTSEGERSLITQLDPDPEKNREAWQSLPEIADFEHLDGIKPGATVLLNAEIGGRAEPLLVHQRYGLGNVYVLATGGTWRWQMQLPHEDMKHETFWRQLLQALASAAPSAVTLTADRVFYPDQGEVKLRADVRNAEFEPAKDATVTLTATHGLEPPEEIAMTAVAGEPGVYAATFAASEPGTYHFEAVARSGSVTPEPAEPPSADAGATADAPDVAATTPHAAAAEAEAEPEANAPSGEELGRAEFAVRRENGVAEHFHLAQNRPLLERIATATGGRYFSLADLDELPEAIRFSEAGVVERDLLDLWNMPINFMLLLLLKAGEWLLRLKWGRL